MNETRDDRLKHVRELAAAKGVHLSDVAIEAGASLETPELREQFVAAWEARDRHDAILANCKASRIEQVVRAMEFMALEALDSELLPDRLPEYVPRLKAIVTKLADKAVEGALIAEGQAALVKAANGHMPFAEANALHAELMARVAAMQTAPKEPGTY